MEMEMEEPTVNMFTVYSKSGCPNCLSVKKLLKEKHIHFKIIDCDEYLLENKEQFLQFISGLTKKEHKTFPMIFDGLIFIGGLNETKEYIEKYLDFDVLF